MGRADWWMEIGQDWIREEIQIRLKVTQWETYEEAKTIRLHSHKTESHFKIVPFKLVFTQE